MKFGWADSPQCQTDSDGSRIEGGNSNLKMTFCEVKPAEPAAQIPGGGEVECEALSPPGST